MNRFKIRKQRMHRLYIVYNYCQIFILMKVNQVLNEWQVAMDLSMHRMILTSLEGQQCRAHVVIVYMLIIAYMADRNITPELYIYIYILLLELIFIH